MSVHAEQNNFPNTNCPSEPLPDRLLDLQTGLADYGNELRKYLTAHIPKDAWQIGSRSRAQKIQGVRDTNHQSIGNDRLIVAVQRARYRIEHGKSRRWNHKHTQHLNKSVQVGIPFIADAIVKFQYGRQSSKRGGMIHWYWQTFILQTKIKIVNDVSNIFCNSNTRMCSSSFAYLSWTEDQPSKLQVWTWSGNDEPSGLNPAEPEVALRLGIASDKADIKQIHKVPNTSWCDIMHHQPRTRRELHSKHLHLA